MRARKKRFVWWRAFVVFVCVVLLQLPAVEAQAAKNQGENAANVKFYGAQLTKAQQEVYVAFQEKYPGASSQGTIAQYNAVRMSDGNWYAVGTTWDDQNPISYAYFLCGRDTICFHGSTFGEDHIEDMELDYPELALSAYSGDGSEQVIEDVGENDIAGQPDLPEQSELIGQMEQAATAVLKRCIEETERCVAFLEENKEWLLPRAGIALAVLALIWVVGRIRKRRK